MPNKSVAFFQESLSDRVVSVNYAPYGGTITVADFPNAHPTFWIQADDESVQDLCTSIDDQTTSVEATFKRSDNSTYQVQSNDFVNNHPIHRPH